MLNGSMARAEDPEAARDYSRNRHAMKRFGRAEEIRKESPRKSDHGKKTDTNVGSRWARPRAGKCLNRFEGATRKPARAPEVPLRRTSAATGLASLPGPHYYFVLTMPERNIVQVEEATLKEKLRGSETNRRKKAKVGPEKGNDAGGDSLQHCSQQR